jgi:HAD superfamily hydrolase (TIGR01509 family)
MIEAVVFDMDGVLVDARDWHFRALNQALGLFGYSIPRSEHQAVYDGLPTRTKLSMLSDAVGLPRGLHQVISALKQDFTLKEALLNCKPEFSVINVLTELRDQGFVLGCASNSVRKSVQTFLQQSEILDFFSVVLSNEDVNKPKPDPEIYRLAMQTLGVSPDVTLVVEDNEHGRLAATNAGAHVLMVSSPSDVTVDRILNQIRSISTTPT